MQTSSLNVETSKIRELIEAVVRERLTDVKVESVIIDSIDFDDDDDVTIRVTVVFDNGGKALDPRKTSGMVRHVRPQLASIQANSFPLFSFVKKSEAKSLSAAVA